MVKLFRAQIARAAPGTGLNVTARAGGVAHHFAPTWKMVLDYKAGRLSQEDYTRQYRAILESVTIDAWRWLYRQARDGELTLLCYCRDEWFCHTYLLIDFVCQTFPRGFSNGMKGPTK